MKCPTFHQLIDHSDGRLPIAQVADLENHLATGCPSCLETYNWYELVRSIAASDDSVTPPPWVLNRALRIFDKRLQRPNLVERLVQGMAALVFDSFARPAMVGVRSTEASNRQLLYHVGELSVDLRIVQSERAGANLIGQVLSESDPAFESVSGLKVEVIRGDEVLYRSVTDEIGEFKIARLDRGNYDLRIELSEGSITVPDLPVGEY